MGLYPQSRLSLLRNYATDLAINAPRNFFRRLKGKSIALGQTNRLVADGSREILSEFIRSKGVKFPGRTSTEMKAMVEVSPYHAEIKAPVVIVQGANDIVSQPEQITGVGILNARDHKGAHPNAQMREERLKSKLFPNSPSVQMIVGEKWGTHNLPYLRPKTVANSALYLLARWHREHPVQATSHDSAQTTKVNIHEE